MTTLTQTYTRLAHDTTICQCHRCERINRSPLLRFIHDNAWWIALSVLSAPLLYAVVLWAVRAFPGLTRVG
ncbi:MAG: hypothetical protein AB1752_14690 [Candidatus Zixiibacteriota bacterium]